MEKGYRLVHATGSDIDSCPYTTSTCTVHIYSTPCFSKIIQSLMWNAKTLQHPSREKDSGDEAIIYFIFTYTQYTARTLHSHLSAFSFPSFLSILRQFCLINSVRPNCHWLAGHQCHWGLASLYCADIEALSKTAKLSHMVQYGPVRSSTTEHCGEWIVLDGLDGDGKSLISKNWWAMKFGDFCKKTTARHRSTHPTFCSMWMEMCMLRLCTYKYLYMHMYMVHPLCAFRCLSELSLRWWWMMSPPTGKQWKLGITLCPPPSWML